MSEGLEAFGYKQELKRSLTLFDLLVYGLVFIVPSAPVAVFGIVYNASKGMVPLIYTIGLVAMVFSALSYMSLSRVYPVSGSAYTYVSHTLGQMMGFLAGWAMLLDYLLLPTLTYVVCAIAVHASFPLVWQPLCVVALIALSTTLNYFGIETTAQASFVLLVLQLVLLAAFLVLGSVALAHGIGGAHLSLMPFFNPAVLTPNLVFGALSLAVLSFLGFDAISTLSEEASGGPPTISKATILSLCLSAFLFVVQTYLASLFVLGKTRFAPGAQTDEAFYNIAALVGGGWFKFTLTVPGVLISGIAGALAAQAATARLLYSMARDGKLPHMLAHVHPVRKVPERAVFLVAGITLVLGVTMVDKLELLTSMVSFGA
ncbi:MAG TPA: APC family permease, partial [Rhizomicrobium sp.]|nr:APC family permease [Rhizomicrobium sp.]